MFIPVLLRASQHGNAYFLRSDSENKSEAALAAEAHVVREIANQGDRITTTCKVQVYCGSVVTYVTPAEVRGKLCPTCRAGVEQATAALC